MRAAFSANSRTALAARLRATTRRRICGLWTATPVHSWYCVYVCLCLCLCLCLCSTASQLGDAYRVPCLLVPQTATSLQPRNPHPNRLPCFPTTSSTCNNLPLHLPPAAPLNNLPRPAARAHTCECRHAGARRGCVHGRQCWHGLLAVQRQRRDLASECGSRLSGPTSSRGSVPCGGGGCSRTGLCLGFGVGG